MMTNRYKGRKVRFKRVSITLKMYCTGLSYTIAYTQGLALSMFLEYQSSLPGSPYEVRGANILELGSGTGLVGIVAAVLGTCFLYRRPWAPNVPRNIV